MAFENWSKFRGEASTATWLYGIALNQWRMSKRRKSVKSLGIEAIEAVAGSFNFAELELAQAIMTLPDPLREAFLLVKGEGLTHAEAAKLVGVPVGTMYFRVHRAVCRLRVSLQPQTIGRGPQLEQNSEQEMSIDPI
jgi:RNA polymerase sigma-70 factor (ECF subfamily)